MPTNIGDKTFELTHYKKLPEVYAFRKSVEEKVPSDNLWRGYETVMVERGFKAYRCQYPKRDSQNLCRGCEIRTTSMVFVEKIQT